MHYILLKVALSASLTNLRGMVLNTRLYSRSIYASRLGLSIIVVSGTSI